MKYFFLTLFLACVFIVDFQAQTPHQCGTEMGRSQFLKDFQAGKYPTNRSGDEWLVLPVQIHITANNDGTGRTSTGLIGRAFQIMNAAMEQAKIQFFVSGDYNLINNTTWHNHTEFRDGRDMMRTHNADGAINIYFCEDAAGACGYYTGGQDAIVMNNDCLDPLNQTLAHELGHFLSLPHPFIGWEGTEYDDNEPTPEFVNGNEVEKLDGSNCNSSADGFCDTSPDYLSDRWPCGVDGLSNQVQYDPNGMPFQSDGTIIMGYSIGACRTWFSGEQIDAMCANVTNIRQELLDHNREYQNLPECQVLSIAEPLDKEILDIDNSLFKWNEIDEVDYYHLEVSKNLNFSDLVVDILTNDTSFLAENLESRLYFWRVTPRADHAPCLTSSAKTWVYVEDISATISISEDEELSAFIANDRLSIMSENFELNQAQIELFDLAGRRVKSIKTDFGVTDLSVDVRDLTSGIYVLRVQTEGFSGTAKLIK